MANDDDKTTIEGAGGETARTASAGKGNNKLILFGGIGLGAVVLGIVLALFVIKPMMAGDSGSESARTEEKTEVKKEPKKKHTESHSGSTIYEISNIVVNPSGTGGSRFLSVSFAFELENSELQTVFEQREPIIRDALITILASKTVAELTEPKQKEIVRYQIRKRISEIMHTEELAGVYYTDFVLQ